MRRLQAASGIMIPCDDYDLQFRPRCAQAAKSSIEKLLCLAGWILAIEYISRNDQHIDLLLDHDMDKLIKDRHVLIFAAMATECVANVPIGGVQNASQWRA